MTGTLSNVAKVSHKISNKDFQRVGRNLLNGLKITLQICTKLSTINYQDSKTNFMLLKVRLLNELSKLAQLVRHLFQNQSLCGLWKK